MERQQKKIGVYVAVVALGVSALMADTYLVNANGNSWIWCQVDGQGTTNTVSAPAASTAVDAVVIAGTSNPRQSGNFTFSSLAFDYAATSASSTPWTDGNGVSTIGAGGVTMSAGNSWTYGCRANDVEDRARVVLAANQTWQGPLDTPWARFAVGYNGYQDYCHTSVKAGNGVSSWQIGGRLQLFLSGSNQLENVDVTIGQLARLRLVGSYVHSSNVYDTNVRLGANSLTIVGGDSGSDLPHLAIGMVNDIKSLDSSLQQTAPDRFDDYMLAPLVTFDGAVRIVSGTARYGLSRLVARNGASTFSGDVVFTTSSPRIEIESGASLEFTGTLMEADGVDTVLDVSGSGSLALPAATAVSGVALDGIALSLACDGELHTAVSGTGSLTLSSSGNIMVPEGCLVGYMGSEIVVTSGTLVLPSIASIAEGVKIRTEGDAALIVVDPTGFDRETDMTGTKNLVSDPLVVTDSPIEGETVSVGAGEVLKVYGSGLKASSRVSVADGGTIRFFRTATVHAPVNTYGGVSLVVSANSVTGTLAGVFTATNTAAAQRYVDVDAPGLVRFSGGGTIWSTPNSSADMLDFRISGGNAEISGAVMTCPAAFRMLSGTMTVKDGGALVNDATYRTRRGFYMNGDLTGDVRLVIGEGGTVTLGNDVSFYIGGTSAGREARVILDGGTLNFLTADHFWFCYSGAGDTVFEINSGTLNTCRQFERQATAGSASVIWRGGTIKAPDSGVTFNFTTLTKSDGISFLLDGNCTLDMNRFKQSSVISNVMASGGAWTATARTTLRVLRSSTANWAARLSLVNFTPNGMAFDLNDARSADVEIVGATDDVAVTWVVPGTNGVLSAAGTSPALVASYLVPSGTGFAPSMMEGWNTGFSSVIQQDVSFESGSSLLLATNPQGMFTPLSIAGALYLDGTLTCVVNAAAKRPAGGSQAVISAAGGISGTCSWAVSGVSAKRTSISTGAGELLFSYVAPGFNISVR